MTYPICLLTVRPSIQVTDGKMYKHLGKKIILKLTSNKEYWESLEE